MYSTAPTQPLLFSPTYLRIHTSKKTFPEHRLTVPFLDYLPNTHPYQFTTTLELGARCWGDEDWGLNPSSYVGDIPRMQTENVEFSKAEEGRGWYLGRWREWGFLLNRQINIMLFSTCWKLNWLGRFEKYKDDRPEEVVS